MIREEMPAGRELDALVAERVMGLVPCDAWSPVNFGSAGGPAMWLDKPCIHEGQCYPVPSEHPCSGPSHYSTNIAVAWEVIERLAVCHPRLSRYVLPDRWIVLMDPVVEGAGGVIKEAETAPLAICRAALAAAAA